MRLNGHGRTIEVGVSMNIGDDRTPSTPAHLSADECWALASREPLGRVAIVRPDGSPDIIPMNVQAHAGHLYFRTAPDAKIAALRDDHRVAVELDGEDEDTRWSVVIHGVMSQVTSEAEIRRSTVAALPTWSPTVKHFVLKLTPREITGRRFPKAASHLDPVYAVSAFPEGADSTPPGEPARADRPFPIPHYSLPPRVRRR